MKIDTYRVGFIGFGHMAKIICRALELSRLVPRSQILFLRRDPHKMREDEKEFGITSSTLTTLVSRSDFILLCVRPLQAEEVLKSIAALELKGKMIISILAGATLSFFEKFLGPLPLIRVMPNIASEVGEGVTILTPNSYVSSEFKSLTNLLFGSMGATIELSEKHMDIATGMTGSGPAYVLSLIEAIARLGEREGISYDQSLKMAAQTFLGAARMLLKGGCAVEELIHQIVVPNGTTEAGLKVMKELDIGKHLQEVVFAAALRSKAISREISQS